MKNLNSTSLWHETIVLISAVLDQGLQRIDPMPNRAVVNFGYTEQTQKACILTHQSCTCSWKVAVQVIKPQFTHHPCLY